MVVGQAISGSRMGARKASSAKLTIRRAAAAFPWASHCASASNKIELRATLNSTGSRIAGNWEERTFNVGGSASGQANGNTIRLAIDAGVLAGSMSVVTNGQSQTISVRTDGAALKGVNISLRRD